MDIRTELLTTLRTQYKAKNKHFFLPSPHVLYATDEQSRLFERATTEGTGYAGKIDKPILKLLGEHARDIFRDVKGEAHFIDLGPGYPIKSFRLIDFLTAQKIKVTYYAVDVSEFFLARAISAATQRGLVSQPLKKRFEELGPILDKKLAPNTVRIIFIGLTFNNFEIKQISRILAAITRQRDLCLICAQLPDGLRVNELTFPYQAKDIRAFAFQPLAILGMKPDQASYAPSFYDSAINTDFQLKEMVRIEEMDFEPGTIFTTAKSYRYSFQKLRDVLGRSFRIHSQFVDKKSNIALLALEGRKS